MLARLAHEVVLGRRPPDDRRGVYGPAPVSDGREMEHGVVVGQGVVPRVVAERPLDPGLSRRHVPLQHDLRVGRDLEVDGLALDQLDRLLAKNARDRKLVHLWRQRHRARPHRRRVAAKRDRHVDPLHLHPLAGPVMPRPHLVALPVHAGSPAVVHLHPVRAHVAAAARGVPADDQRQGDEPASVLGPARQDGQPVEAGILARQHHFLARRVPHRPGLASCESGEVAQRPELVHKTLGRRLREARQLAYPRYDLFDIVHAQGPGDPLVRAV